jgi:hypothetical protein
MLSDERFDWRDRTRAPAVRRLVEAQLVAYRFDDADEIEWELGGDGDEDVMAGEFAIALTERGLAIVERWVLRVRAQFGDWPPARPDVDDAIG